MYKSGHKGDQKPEAHMWRDTKAVLLHEMDEGTRLLVSAENCLDTGNSLGYMQGWELEHI